MAGLTNVLLWTPIGWCDNGSDCKWSFAFRGLCERWTECNCSKVLYCISSSVPDKWDLGRKNQTKINRCPLQMIELNKMLRDPLLWTLACPVQFLYGHCTFKVAGNPEWWSMCINKNNVIVMELKDYWFVRFPCKSVCPSLTSSIIPDTPHIIYKKQPNLTVTKQCEGL